MKIGVVIPVLSQFRLAVDALASVKTTHDWQPYIIPNYRDGNGVARSWNLGTKAAIGDDCDYVLIINDDIVLHPNAIDVLVELFEQNPTYGLVSSTDARNEFVNSWDITHAEPLSHVPEVIDAPDFACFMLRPACFHEVGDFDENFKPAYFEDNDYCYRVVLHPTWEIVRSQNSAFFHHGSQTQNNTQGGPVVPSPQFEMNKQYYKEKWGGVPGRERWDVPFNEELSPHPFAGRQVTMQGVTL